MDPPENTNPGEDKTPFKQYEPGSSYHTSKLNRHGSISTIGSEKPPVSTGTFTLTLHGNCTKCHHHHRSYTVTVKASDDSKEPTPVNCERCKQRWLTIGGRNITQLSLLSSKTIDVDSEEIDFRFTLINMILSATAIASPTLASVPEVSSHLPSRDGSPQSGFQRTERKLQPVASQNNGQVPQAPRQAHAAVKHQSPAISEHQESDYPKPRSPKAILKRFRSVLKDAFPMFKDVQHLRGFIKAPGKVKITAKGEGKRPGADCLHKIREVVGKNRDELNTKPNSQHKKESVNDTTDVYEVHKSTGETIEYPKDSGLMELLISMSPAERYAWLRQQITDRKSYHLHQLGRRYSSSMVDSSTQVDHLPGPPGSMRRRYSFAEIGSHLNPRLPDSRYSYVDSLGYHYPWSIAISPTRTSEAETAVDAQSFISSPRYSFNDPTHRSSSPRPPSFHSPLYSSRHFRGESTYRSSMDSIATHSRSLWRIGERGRERRSIGSVTHMTVQSSRTDVGNVTEVVRPSQDTARELQNGEDGNIPTAASPP